MGKALKYEPPIPEDEVESRIVHDIDKFGFHIVGISDDGDLQKMEYAFTIGFYHVYGIPEVIMYGVPYEATKELFWSYRRWISDGGEPIDGAVMQGISSFPLRLRTVDVSWYRDLLGCGIWYYHKLKSPFPCLQMYWPDPNGIFDTEMGYDEKYRKIQPDISKAKPGFA